MSKLKISLHTKPGVTFEEEHVSGQKYLDFWTMKSDLEENQEKYSIVDIIEKRLEFTASLFSSSEITPETILAGTNPWDLMPLLNNIENIIIGTDDNESKKE
ncbi:phage tail assembly chaperone G [Lactococcus formosensis]|uniref:Phage protein n=1 Tax=Lactococcus formosensis TaxID=1281486 RepID=A0A9X4PC44_9LACT|nr:hypothetical protein [Lactococcus formosensis]MCH1723571.1 hypothetical protein [Lactococcus formosensis]MDG6126450.1 hypothetical protein [Lactococcus formosensis]MDG6131862.1 hypothetical protein [Lactococcus formosensis]MDG6133859.1 hypothetical protein [Lactococcus formosensis]MDG6140515.1 hypothetical protein [Lactococcus formosensis]